VQVQPANAQISKLSSRGFILRLSVWDQMD
jgi:hypothetical protein